MQFRHVTVAQLEAAIASANRDHGYDIELLFTSGKDGNFRARIAPRSSRAFDRYGKDTGELAHGARYSPSAFNDTRRVKAACWHAHRDVFRALYALAPDAIIRTGLGAGIHDGRPTVYNGREHFEATFPATAYINVGAPIYPRTMASLCNCD